MTEQGVFIGDTIRRLMKEKGMTQEDLAELLGKNRTQISLWVTGVRNPEMASCIKIAEVFGLTLDQFLGRENIRPGDQYSEPSLHHEIDILIRRGLLDPDKLRGAIKLLTEEAPSNTLPKGNLLAAQKRPKFVLKRGKYGGKKDTRSR